MAVVTLARQFVEVIRQAGIKRVYGLPGEDHMELLDAFKAAGLEYHTAYNETSAVLMAAADATLTGLPGVAVVSMAPGVSNAINGILSAFMDEQPVLVISGRHRAAQAPFIVRQGFPTETLVEPVTKWRGSVVAGIDVAALAGRAIEVALSGRPGPVFVEFPDEAAATPAGDVAQTEAAAARVRARVCERSGGALASAARVEELAARLARAQRPVLIVGGHAQRLDPAVAAAFATAYRSPVLTSTRQKGLIPPSHPYCAGTFLNGRLERELLAQSDLALLVDPEAFDFYNRPWAFDAEAVAIVADDFTEWINPFSELVVADPGALLRELTARAGRPVSRWTPADVSGYQERVRAQLLGPAEGAEADVPTGTLAGGMSVPAAVAAVLDVFPQNGFLTADAGFSKPILAMLSQPSLPNRFLASNGLSTMGFSIPAALAVSRTGAAPVAAFMGDGSLLMRATELAAGAAGLPVPLVAVAIVDRALTQIAVKQERRALDTVGTALPALSCALLAQSLGIDGIDVDNAADLRAAASAALQRRRPTLIGAVVDPGLSRPLFELMRG